MKTTKRVLTIVLLLILSLSMLVACNKNKDNPTLPPEELKDAAIQHELEFGGVYVLKTIDEFNAMRYKYGDSVDVTFSNGYEIKDIPYYNGYYTQNGEKLLVAYPGYPYIKVCINNGNDLFSVANLSDTDTATIKLNTAGKYWDIQNARDIHYYDERSRYTSDEQFANFRWVNAGDIKPYTLFRSASPCDNQHNRAPYVDKLIDFAEVNFILDLADTDAKIDGYIAKSDFNSPYFKFLYDNGNVDAIALNMNYGDGEPEQTLLMGILGDAAFKAKLVAGLNALFVSGGPYLVHCTEGKDRTGFVCMLLEALCGATYQEIVDDYMITYDNYYGIKKGDSKYQIIVDSLLVPMIKSIVNDNTVDIKTADLSEYAKNWLISGGMLPSEVQKIIDRLTSSI